MPRKSVKKDKNTYFKSREEAGLTRAQASELTYISESRIDIFHRPKRRICHLQLIAKLLRIQRNEIRDFLWDIPIF